MPVYLLHGFRWPREGFSGIRVHTIVHNLEDCSAEYIQNDHSREELLNSFRKLYPELMKDLDASGTRLEFIEQYDPDDESDAAVTQPFAYFADKVVEIAGQTIAQPEVKDKPKPASRLLSVNIEEVIADGPGLTPQAWEALADLRDKIAEGEKIGWWVVYNGDPERAYDSDDPENYDEEYDEEEEATTPTAETAPTKLPEKAVVTPSKPEAGPPVPPKTSSSSFGSKMLPTRNKQEIEKPEAVLPSPSDEKIPEPPKLKEVSKASGFRKKFFGKKI